MTEPTAADALQRPSAALAALAAAAAPALVALDSARARATGFVWKPGLLLTADEALEEDGEITATFADGRSGRAEVAGRDPSTDIALLRADTGSAPAAALGGEVPPAGSLVLAMGALGAAPLAAFGVVALAGPAWRSLRGGEVDARIELDLRLRPEAEGGLALGMDGRAFGMTAFGPRRRPLVIPAATLARVAALLETHGRAPRGYLGLGLQPVRLDGDGGSGVMVMSVEPEGPGAAAGVRQGDVLTAFDGRPLPSPAALARALGPASVGRTVRLEIRRGGAAILLEIRVGERL